VLKKRARLQEQLGSVIDAKSEGNAVEAQSIKGFNEGQAPSNNSVLSIATEGCNIKSKV